MSIKTPVATSHMLTSPMSQDSFRQHQGPLSPIHTPRSPPSPKTLAMSSFKYPVPQAPNDAQDATPEYEYEDSAAKSADHTWDTYEPAQDLHNSESSHAHYRLANFALPRSSSGPPHLQENIPPDLHPYVRMTYFSTHPTLTHVFVIGYDLHFPNRWLFCKHCFANIAHTTLFYCCRSPRCFRWWPYAPRSLRIFARLLSVPRALLSQMLMLNSQHTHPSYNVTTCIIFHISIADYINTLTVPLITSLLL